MQQSEQLSTSSELNIQEFVRNPITVKAIQVTEENMEAVAEWCEGRIKSLPDKGLHIKVDVIRPLNIWQTRGFPGDWILESPTGFRVYTDEAFSKQFALKEVGDGAD